MPLLTLAQIQFRAQLGTLFTPFQLKTPMTITSSELMWTLTLFKEEQQMIDFIICLSENPDVCIQVNRKTIQQGCAANFLHAYTEHGLYPSELDKNRQAAIISHFSRHQFKKAQLIYLLKNMNDDSIHDFLLKTKCFDETELLDVCNDFAIVTALSATILKYLYHYFNPIRRWQESTTPFLDMHYFAYRAGHVLGLSEPITVYLNKQPYRFETEYAPTEVSLKVLHEHIEAYANTSNSAMFQQISMAVKKNWQLFKKNSSSYIPSASGVIYQQYRNNELAFICCGWDYHTVTVVLYGDYLIYANRGPHADPNYGAKIFSITDTTLITRTWIQSLINKKSAEGFNRALSEVIQFKKPVSRFPSKLQNHANCTFANPKSSVEPIVVLLQAGPHAPIKEVQQVAYQERFRRKYKHFTTFIRDREVDGMVKNMFYATHPHLISFYASLVKDIIQAHHGACKPKDRQERARAVDLFARTPAKIQKIIREDDLWMEQFKEICEKERTPLPSLGVLWAYTHHVYNKTAHRSHNVVTDQGYIIAIDGVGTPKMPFSLRNTRKLCTQMLKSW